VSQHDGTAPRHLLVIGAQRCGTTYLHHLLEAHPQVAMARPARPEPKVFLDPELSARGREWYRETWFGHAGDARILGDKSTSYLEHPEAAGRARRMLGDPLVHVQLRDPVQRAVSNWAFSTDNGYETRPLAEALEACLDDEDDGWAGSGTSVSPFAYLRRGRYVDDLAPWVDEYRDDLSVGFLEDLVTDPASIAATYRFLGVDDTFLPADARTPVNESSGAPALPDELRARIRDYFAASDAALAELLGRPVPWPSPQPDQPQRRGAS